MRQATGLSTGNAVVGGRRQQVSVADPAQLDAVLDLKMAAGSIAGLSGRQLAVAEPVADDKGWRTGTAVPVRFADGATETLTVGAIYLGSGPDVVVGDYLLPRAEWAPHATQDVDATVLIKLDDGVSLAAGKAAVQRAVAACGGPEVQDRQEYAGNVAGGVNQLLTIVDIMLVLAIVIALMGIADTLSLSVHERTRELGLLGVVLAVGAVAGVLAGIRPARRAARLNLLRAIAVE